MSSLASGQPIPYQPSVESLEEDEQKNSAALTETLKTISSKTFEDSGHAIRSVHAKSHGLLVGTLEVLDGLPSELAQGLFERPATYPVVMRFSTIPGDILDDKVSTPRGLAIKVIGVDGERVEGSERDVTQDFVLVDAPAFGAPTVKAFLSNVKQLAPTTDRAPGLKKALSASLQQAEKLVEAFGGKSAKLTMLGGHPETNPLGETYFSQAPLLYGTYMAKVAVAPLSPALRALKGAKVDLRHQPDGLREALSAFFRTQGGEWELRVQLCQDLQTMPVEDSSVEWPEARSPYRAVARIKVEPQESWSEARAQLVDDGLAFSPWHALAAHRPLGSIMRARKQAYEMSTRFRAEHNHRVIEEPRSAEQLQL